MKQLKDPALFTLIHKNQLKCAEEVLFSFTDAIAVLQEMIAIHHQLDVQQDALF
jgi:hypothetical protein